LDILIFQAFQPSFFNHRVHKEGTEDLRENKKMFDGFWILNIEHWLLNIRTLKVFLFLLTTEITK